MILEFRFDTNVGKGIVAARGYLVFFVLQFLREQQREREANEHVHPHVTVI